jgi:hypothetical protein
MTDQTLASITAAQPIAIGTLAEANGISIENADEVTFEYEGTYSLTFSAQITNYANSVQKAVFWVKKNGVDYPDSATEIDLQPRKSSGVPNRQVITINYVATAEAGDYVQVYWAGDSTDLKVESLPAGTSPVYPAVPSIILTAVQVMYTQVGPEGPQGPAGEGSSVTVSETAPTGASEGDQWYDSTTGESFIYYDNYWVELNNSLPGPQGVAGPQGEKGDKGDRGFTGAAGINGTNGTDGPPGVVAATAPIIYNAETQTIGINQSNLASISGNVIINGAFDIWQRGTSFAFAGGVYGADRWMAGRSGVAGATFSRQSAALTGFEFSARIARNSGNTSTIALNFAQSIETKDSIPLAGKTVTLSFYAKKGANFSAASNVLQARLLSGTGTDQNLVLVAITGQATVIDQNVTLTDSWQRFSFTANVGSTATQLFANFNYTPVGTAGANDWYEITGVQLEESPVATPFRRNANTIAGELAACQRYYQLIKSGAFNSPTLFRIRAVQNDYYGMIPYLVKPRISTGFGYTINSPANIIHKPAIRWDTISSISFTDMGTYLDVTCRPTVDDGSSMIGIHLYGIDIFCNAEL